MTWPEDRRKKNKRNAEYCLTVSPQGVIISGMKKPLSQASFVVQVTAAGGRLAGQFLAGPRSPKDVRKLGYRFVPDRRQAWPFPSAKSASAKATIVDRHMGWGFGVSLPNSQPSDR